MSFQFLLFKCFRGFSQLFEFKAYLVSFVLHVNSKLIKVACMVKANMTWTTKNITLSHYFSKKFKTSTLQGHKKVNEILGIGNIYFAYSNFSGKNDAILLKSSARAPSPYRIKFFWFIFLFNIFVLKKSSRRCLIFSLLSVVFEKPPNISRQESLFNQILKECLISKNN